MGGVSPESAMQVYPGNCLGLSFHTKQTTGEFAKYTVCYHLNSIMYGAFPDKYLHEHLQKDK